MDEGRRKFLKYAGTFAAGAAASRLPDVFRDTSVEKAERKIYKQGDEIPTSIGPIKIEGWGLLIKDEDVLKYNRAERSGYDSEAAQFTILAHRAAESQIQVLFGPESSQIKQDQQIGSDHLPTVTLKDKKGEEVIYRRIMVLPEGEKTPVMVNFSRTSTDRNSEAAVLENKTYYVTPEFHGENPSYSRNFQLFSEKEIDSRVRADLAKVGDFFSPLLNDRASQGSQNTKEGSAQRPNLRIYIYHDDSNEVVEPTYFLLDNRVVMGDTEVAKPKYEQEAAMSLWHELTHALVNYLKNLSFKGFEYLSQTDGGFSAIDLTVSEESPNLQNRNEHRLFQMFKESSYVPEPRAGHPADNSDEFTASTFSILHFKTAEFLRKYEQLDNPKHKEAVRIVVWSILLAIEQLGEISKRPSLKYDFVPDTISLIQLEKMAAEYQKSLK